MTRAPQTALESTPRKAISPARDRLQSNALVGAISPILCILCIRVIAHALALPASDPRRHYLLAEVAISLAFALFAWLLKAATPAAAASGGAICLLLTNCSLAWPPSVLRSGLPPLALLFALTFAATRFGRAKKEAHGLSEPRTGRRASQVIANLGVAALVAAFSDSGTPATLIYAAALAALAEATADTLSSEIGQAVAGSAILVTTLRRVPPGTDGAISLAGTLAGLLGAAAVIVSGLPHLFGSAPPLTFAAIFTAATAGLFFDSLLGATLERRGYLGNDLVNFTSTAIAALALYPFAKLVI